MIIASSTWRRLFVTAVAVTSFISVYEVTTLDSRYAARQAVLRESTAIPSPGARLAFSATAYCKGAVTAAGAAPRSGIAAADPDLLPLGSVVEIEGLPGSYNGIYTVMDTGPAVNGRHVDLYMWSCNEALQFGRRPIHLTVLRLGWNPRQTTPATAEGRLEQPVPTRSHRAADTLHPDAVATAGDLTASR